MRKKEKIKNLGVSASLREPKKKTDANPALVPKLRFPEFQDAGEWREKTLVDACKMQSGKFVAASEIKEQNANGMFPCYGGNGLRGFTATHTHHGTYPLIGRQGALCGNVKLATGRFHATEHAVVATPNQGVDLVWLYYLLDLLNLNRFATGQAQPGLSVDVLEKVPVAIPKDEREQQRIAACLSSLDELIAAQARKVNALKTHKKGLMQKLFPREGETQPRLRFPEFEDAGKWQVKKLGEFANVAASGDLESEYFSPSKTENCCYPVYSNSVENEGLYGFYSVPKYPENCVTVTARGTLGVAFLRKSKFMGIGRLLVLDLNQGVDSRFIKECWNHLAKIPQEVTSIPQLTAVTARVTIFPIPSLNEQHHIASCLSTLDDLIAAQTQKFAALKTHKRGLMQQLFPAAEEVGA